jgi:hypothetical protein
MLLRFPKRPRHRHARASVGSSGYKSGRNCDRETPVARSTSSTRSAGTWPSSQRNTVLLFTPKLSAMRSSVNGGSLANRNLRSGLMAQQVASNATACQAHVAFGANDATAALWLTLRMARTHYIPEWAHGAGKKQADIVKELEADKAIVSRWFREGIIPSKKYLAPLAKFLGAPEPAALFVHPEEYKILVEIRALASRKAPAA